MTGGLRRIGRRVAYPLRQVLVPRPVAERLVLVGNAAHMLHPVAGQGFNLGLRDVAVLADLLADAARTKSDPGGTAVTDAYARRRKGDHADAAWATDTLARLFVNPWGPLRLLRDAGLLGLDLIPSARQALARRFMGVGSAYAGAFPRLALGLPLDGRHD